jgi:DNA-binding MarR family transcriptional regulator
MKQKESGAKAAPVRPMARRKVAKAAPEPVPSVDAPPSDVSFTHTFVPYLINHVASLFNSQFKKDLRASGISVMQWRALAVLRESPGLSLRDLSEMTAIDQPTLSRIIDQLNERELIERTSRLSDGRYLTLMLTAEGETTFEKLWALAWRHYRRGTVGLSEAETETLTRLLQKTLASLKQ